MHFTALSIPRPSPLQFALEPLSLRLFPPAEFSSLELQYKLITMTLLFGVFELHWSRRADDANAIIIFYVRSDILAFIGDNNSFGNFNEKRIQCSGN